MTTRRQALPSNTNTPTRPQEIAAKLTRRILSEEFPTGSKLPTERDLATQFETTRNVVREALKRLEAVGLVRIRQGSGIYVQNLQLTGGVELFDILLTRDDGSINIQFLHDVLEFRGHMVRLIVRLAAVRRTDEELVGIRQLVRERRAFMLDNDRASELTLKLFQQIAYAAHNRVYQLMFNTVERLSIELRAMIDVPLLGPEQTQAILERVVDAFDQKDDAMAELVVIRYVEALERALAFQQVPSGLLRMTLPPTRIPATE
jgi:DNA-binding FadR family transcriptional regulator